MAWIGCVDILSDTCISGWAADDADLARTVAVDLWINSRLVVALACDGFRQDLLAAGIGDGRKAFRYDPCGHLSPGRNTIEVRFAGTDVLVHKGQGHWVRRRESAGEWADLIAALEAYEESLPENEICASPATSLESVICPDGKRRLFGFPPVQGAPAPPVLAHIHVPKCAGTSFRNMLERYWGPKHLGLYVNDTYFAYGEETLRSYLQQDPAILALSSHHVRTFPHWLAGREMLYVTFLRDPVEQFVSYMTHIQKHYATITSPSLLAAVPPDAPKLTLREFACWLLTQERDIPFRENHNVNFFARHSAPHAADRLEAAKATLSEFFFVGVTERMEESIAKLRLLAQQKGLDFPPGPVPMENTSAEMRDDLSWINPDDEVGSLLLRSAEKDRQLYDWAATH